MYPPPPTTSLPADLMVITPLYPFVLREKSLYIGLLLVHFGDPFFKVLRLHPDNLVLLLLMFLAIYKESEEKNPVFSNATSIKTLFVFSLFFFYIKTLFVFFFIHKYTSTVI